MIQQKENEDMAQKWYVLRDLKRANTNTPAYKVLKLEGYEVFTPMHSIIRNLRGKKLKMEVPFIHDLLFIHGMREDTDKAISSISTLQYRYQRGAAYCQPMTVRDDEMQRFMHFIEISENPKYYLPEELTPKMCGRKARIVGGKLDGYEGNILSVRGSRKRQLVIEFSGLFSVGVEVDADYVQLI